METFNFAASSAIPKKKRLCYRGDFDEADVTSPTKAQKLLQRYLRLRLRSKSKLLETCESLERLKKKVEFLQGLLDDLKGNVNV